MPKNLPACEVKNSKTTETYSKEMTDTIAYWLKSGYVCGPFDEPPFKNFRVNLLQAVPQDIKVRPVLNVSRPEGQSVNDNIDKNMLEKVKMSSARNFGYSIKKCGKKADLANLILETLIKTCQLQKMTCVCKDSSRWEIFL